MVASQDKDTLSLTSEAMAAMMTTELTVGCLDDASVKAGIVGEIGCTYPLHGESPSEASQASYRTMF